MAAFACCDKLVVALDPVALESLDSDLINGLLEAVPEGVIPLDVPSQLLLAMAGDADALIAYIESAQTGQDGETKCIGVLHAAAKLASSDRWHDSRRGFIPDDVGRGADAMESQRLVQWIDAFRVAPCLIDVHNTEPMCRLLRSAPAPSADAVDALVDLFQRYVPDPDTESMKRARREADEADDSDDDPDVAVYSRPRILDIVLSAVHGKACCGREVDVAEDSGAEPDHCLAVDVDNARRDLGLVTGAAVGEGRVGVSHGDRRDDRGSLAERHLDVVSGVPLVVRETLGRLGV